MLEGCCPKCGTRRVGWALRFPRYQSCPECGTGLEITENGQPIGRGYSPFTAEEYIIRPRTKIPAEEERDNPSGASN